MSYLVRIELHSASYPDYEALHRAMALRGFARTIRASDGKIYQLPTAEYAIETTMSGEQIRSQASAAADTTGRQYGVLVVAYNSAWWTGLTLARAA
jgi:hypothetical protein